MSTEEFRKEQIDGNDVEILLRGLKKVNAPQDFDIRLRARIANYTDVKPKPFVFGFVRLAAPAALVLFAALAGYFTFFELGNSETVVSTNIVTQQMPEVEETLGFAPGAGPTSAPVLVNQDTTVAVSAVNTVSRPELRNTAPANAKRVEREPVGGGSEDRAATAPDATIFPPGLTPDQPFNGRPASPQGDTEISIQQVFSLLGVKAVYGESGWKVVSAESAGAAAKSGLRAGDVIVSLGTTVLGASTVFRAPANISSLRVMRSGEVIELRLGK